VILAHCSWYFGSLDQLRRVLLRIRPWARRLCFSEWDIAPSTFDQIPHLFAVLIQGQVEAFKPQSVGNVRTPLSRTRLMQLLQETGWNVSTETTLIDPQLQDADWEIGHCLRFSLAEAEALSLPSKFLELMRSQVVTLRSIAKDRRNSPFPSYVLVAERSSEMPS
jgi:hypothetical protein